MNLYLETGILASALVREYLHRKGFIRTLDVLDDEFPREPNSINKTSTLIRELNLELVYRANKLRKFPFNSLIEMVVHNIKSNLVDSRDKKCVRNFNTEVENYKSDNKKLSMLQLKVLHEKLVNRGINIDFVKLVKINCGCMYSENRASHDHNITSELETIQQKQVNENESLKKREKYIGVSESENKNSINGDTIEIIQGDENINNMTEEVFEINKFQVEIQNTKPNDVKEKYTTDVTSIKKIDITLPKTITISKNSLLFKSEEPRNQELEEPDITSSEISKPSSNQDLFRIKFSNKLFQDDSEGKTYKLKKKKENSKNITEMSELIELNKLAVKKTKNVESKNTTASQNIQSPEHQILG